MPEGLQLWVKRIQRDSEFIAMLEKEVETFTGIVDQKVQQLRDIAAGNR
jgi:hypothetical protein